MRRVSSTEFAGYTAEMLSQLADLAHEHGLTELRDAISNAHAAARDSVLQATICDISREAQRAGKSFSLANGFGG
jgi:hypothetical protein